MPGMVKETFVVLDNAIHHSILPEVAHNLLLLFRCFYIAKHLSESTSNGESGLYYFDPPPSEIERLLFKKKETLCICIALGDVMLHSRWPKVAHNQ